MDIVRMHVRALDESEDQLLQYYLEAAIDYLAQQTNRLLGTTVATVMLDRDEASELINLQGINDIQVLPTPPIVEYLKDDGTYESIPKTQWRLTPDYPASLDLTEVEVDSGLDQDLFRVTLTCGASLGDLPKQYHQAALLLVGHYYNQRETEVIGQITSELKEGVRRLVMSARQF